MPKIARLATLALVALGLTIGAYADSWSGFYCYVDETHNCWASINCPCGYTLYTEHSLDCSYCEVDFDQSGCIPCAQ